MVLTRYRDTVDPRPLTPIGYGTVGGTFVRFRRIFRDSGANWSLPDWQVNPRITRIQIPNGGVYLQRNGYDTDTLTLRVELESVDAAATLRGMTSDLLTLVLPDPPYSTRGTYNWIHTTGYRNIPNVLLSAVDAAEGLTARANYPRVTLTFEMNRL